MASHRASYSVQLQRQALIMIQSCKGGWDPIMPHAHAGTDDVVLC